MTFATSPDGAPPPQQVHIGTMEAARHTRWVVLAEGPSDQAAVEVLARRQRRDLAAEGVEVVSSVALTRSGSSWATFRRMSGRPGSATRARWLHSGALSNVGMGPAATPTDLEALGFFVCEPDLEGELIRALGAPGVEAVLETTGKLTAFRTFQKQPQRQGRRVESQLRRFFGSSAGKIRHAPLMVEALDLDRIPKPLDSLLAHVG